MRIFKTSFFLLFSTVLFLSACSKSSSDEVTPEPEEEKVTNKVMQTLIENFKGSATVTTQNENNDVIFGIKFTSSKDGKITKLRRSTGSTDRALVKIWYYENNSWKDHKEQEIVATAAGDVFSGDTEVDWAIKEGVEYHIGIRLFKRTLENNSNRVRRLVGTNNIAFGNATVGPITFKKEFYWATHSTANSSPEATKYPLNTGENAHFAGFLDFDFESN